MSKIYIASSWRCIYQPEIVKLLRAEKYEVYDFRNPQDGNKGFHWSEIDAQWQGWDPTRYRKALSHPIAKKGFNYDFDAMRWADTCVLVLPCGRSSHIEAGYFVGRGKPLHVLISEKCEPELMYKMATSISISVYELLDNLRQEPTHAQPER
jgi:hypothetical protein